MQKVINNLLKRRFFVILLLLIQVAILVFILSSSSSGLSFFIIQTLAVITVIVIYASDKVKIQMDYKTLWIIIILLFPFFGLTLYLMVHFQSSTKIFKREVEKSSEIIAALYEKSNNKLNKLTSLDDCEFLPEFKYLNNVQNFPVYNNTEATYYPLGDDFFEALIPDLKKAEKYIFIEFFIIEEGVMWNTILDILKEKAASGVDVRIIYDDVGCLLTLQKGYAEYLRSLGIKVVVFNKFIPLLTAVQNNRDHRKIISIDGKIAYTGGCNLADEYINKVKKYGHWKDCAIRLKGDAAWSFTVIFISTWIMYNKDDLDYKKLLPDFSDSTDSSLGFLQPFCDNPTDDELITQEIYLKIIQKAKKYIYINTPYLILDSFIEKSLIHAAQSGVEVIITTPYIPDKKMVHLTTRSYYKKLVDAGVKIYEYANGFIHSKTIVADDKVAVIGSANFDYRSLYLQFECAVLLYNCPVIREMVEDYKNTLPSCTQITPDKCNYGVIKRLFQAFLRFVAPLM